MNRLITLTTRRALPLAQTTARLTPTRHFTATPPSTKESPTENIVPDALAEGGAKGKTGGGEPLDSSRDPPPQPKILSASIPGNNPKLTEEQQKEVDAHNAEFEKKHGKATVAEDDKVDKNFWSGGGGERKEGEGPSD